MTPSERCLDYVTWYEASYQAGASLDELFEELIAHFDTNEAKVRAILGYLVKRGQLVAVEEEGQCRYYLAKESLG
jgi:DNA-binding transcriptional regulator PaaX